ncbi:hypothetical protein GCM10009504_22290 [Pseudomonas laurentiana]|nr:hypothetical protein GCM10009504_22290 [Pseudomonas laurentiana]
MPHGGTSSWLSPSNVMNSSRAPRIESQACCPLPIERKSRGQMALAVNAQGLTYGTRPAANVADVTEVTQLLHGGLDT